MRQLGLMIHNLKASELSWRLIRQINSFSSSLLDVGVFVGEPCEPCLPILTAVFPDIEAYGYMGDVIALDYSSARKLRFFPSPERRIFYVWDLEWMRKPGFYREWQKVYADPGLTLVARTLDQKKLLEDLWCREVAGVCGDANILELMDLMRGV